MGPLTQLLARAGSANATAASAASAGATKAATATATAGASGALSAATTGFTLLVPSFSVTTARGFAAALGTSFMLGFVDAVASQFAGESGAVLRGGGKRTPLRRLGVGVLVALSCLAMYANVLAVLSWNLWVMFAVALGHGLGFVVYDAAVPPASIDDDRPKGWFAS